MFKHIINDKIELRLLDLHHGEELFNSVDSNREHLREFMAWVDSNTTVDDSRNFIQNSKKRHAANEGFDTGIWYEDEFAGIIGFYDMNPSIKEISIGYWLEERFVGKGIITKSAKVLIDYAFNILQLNRVEITCEESNNKSKAVLERLGFTKEGIMRDGEILNGSYVNKIIYSMLRKEWAAQRKSEKLCPLCGRDNNCQSGQANCWCNEVVVPDYVINMVAEDKKGKACICRSCVEKYK